MNPSIKARMKDWKRLTEAGRTGPLQISKEIVDLASHWETYRAQCGGLDCTSWLRKNLGAGHGLAFFRRRATAVDQLGEAIRRWMDHEVACYVASKVPTSIRGPVLSELFAATTDNNGIPLTRGQATPIISRLLGVVSQPKKCAKCEVLRAILLSNGITPPL